MKTFTTTFFYTPPCTLSPCTHSLPTTLEYIILLSNYSIVQEKKEIEKNGKRKKTLNFKSKVCQKLFLKLKKETLINFYAYLNTLTKYLSTTVQLLTHANKEINLYLKPFEYSSVCFQSHFQRCKNSWKSKL